MFELYGENQGIKKVITYNEAEHKIIIRCSYATTEARKPGQGGLMPGRLPHGRHAANNVGVSVMRAGRELELNLSWSIEEQTERWLGIEVEFPPSLDEVFGVSNNKQTARFFDNIDISELADQRGLKESVTELKEVLSEEQDPRGPLIEISETINRNIRLMRSLISEQTRGTRTRRHDDPSTAEARGTKAVRDRQLEGIKGDSDADENLPEDERKAELAKELENTAGLDPQAAKELAARTIDQGLKFTYESAQLETAAFFSVRSKAGELLITLNTAHPAYEQLFQLLDLDESGLPEEDGAEVKERLSKASTSFKLLIESWARFEDEQTDGIGKERIQDMRSDWGRIARQFLRPF